jgi:hypothetical protein
MKNLETFVKNFVDHIYYARVDVSAIEKHSNFEQCGTY